MGARLHTWWQKIKTYPVAAVLITAAIALVAVVLLGGYQFHWNWTGFNGNTKSSKTLWDWMQLLFIPVVLAVAGFWFNHREREIEQQRAEADRKISSDNQCEAALKEYIDKIAELLLRENLCKSEPVSEVRKVARVRTLTVLPRLDGRRKRSVLQFLFEADLINKNNPIVDLQGADFSDANMFNVDLHGAMFHKVNMSGASLRNANLSEVDLSDALLGTNFKVLSIDKYGEPDDIETYRTYLGGANLSGAILINTDLSEASLHRVNLSKAVLDGADLSYADLRRAKSLINNSKRPNHSKAQPCPMGLYILSYFLY